MDRTTNKTTPKNDDILCLFILFFSHFLSESLLWNGVSAELIGVHTRAYLGQPLRVNQFFSVKFAATACAANRDAGVRARKKNCRPQIEGGSSAFLDFLLLPYGTWLPDLDFTSPTSPALIVPLIAMSARKLAAPVV